MKKWWKNPEQRLIVSRKISESLRLKHKPKKVTFRSVFKGKIRKQPDGCWIWLKSKNQKGYGVITINKKIWSTHRLSYTLKKGNILRDMCVCHTCDNPSCINPDHLFLGTMGDNMLDMMKKGRGRISKLSEDDKNGIKYLYESGYSVERIAEKYDTSHGVVKFILGIPYNTTL